MPPTHRDEGLRAALEIRDRHPSVGVLVLSQYLELGLALALLSESADGVGYLLKDRITDIDEFVAAVRSVAAGGSGLGVGSSSKNAVVVMVASRSSTNSTPCSRS